MQKNSRNRRPRKWPSIAGNAEERASTGLARLEDITRLVSEWVWEADPDGRLVFVSERVEEVLGFLPVELVGKKLSELGSLSAEGNQGVDPDWRAPFRDLRFDMPGKNGVIRRFLVSGLPFHDRVSWELKGFCGIAEDITERRRAEEGLRESEERYRTFYEKTPVMVHSINRESQLVSVSDKWLDTLRYSRDEVIGRMATDFMTEATRRFAKEIVLPEFFRTGSATDVPYQFVKKNGEIIDVALSAIAEKDAKGNFLRSYAVLIDVTERKRAEEALRENEERYRLFVNNVDEGVFLFQDGKTIDISDVGAAMFGYDRDEAIGRSPLDFTAPHMHAAVRKLISEGHSEAYESELLRKDGSTFPAIVRGKQLEFGGRKVRLTTVLDITKHREDEAALRESEEKHRSLFETITQGVVYQDASGNITSANRVAETLLGLSFDQMQGRKSTDPRWKVIKEDGSEFTGETHPAMTALKTGENVLGVVMGVFVPEGDEFRWITVDAIPQFRNGEDKPYQVFTTFSDITERRKAAATLLEAKNEAERANQAKSEFLSSMSHELRTPLNAILGFAQLLESGKKTPLSDRQKDQVQYIKNGGERLVQLIDDILDMIRLDTKELSFSMAPVDGRNLVDGCLSFAEKLAAKRDIVIEDRTGGALPVLWADPLRSRQALENLFSNAVKYNCEDGTVWLDAEQHDNRVLRISVTDTGPGIPKHKQSDLFRPFNRLGAETSAIEGTGIGLVLTKRLVEEMGGTVGFESIPGEGSTFWIDFLLAAGRGTGAPPQ